MISRIRSAISGRFVKRATARRHPDTTVVEHDNRRPVAPPSERSGVELRQAVLLAAAEAVVDSERPSGGFESYVDSSALRRLRAAIAALGGEVRG